MRLHQILPTLKEGVNLPTKVRDLSRLPGKQDEAARRSAIALPLLWHLLTGEKFSWSESVLPDDQVSETLCELFERYRVALVDSPSLIEEDLFARFARFLSEDPIESEEACHAPVVEPDDSLEEALRNTLYEGEINLSETTPHFILNHTDGQLSGANGFDHPTKEKDGTFRGVRLGWVVLIGVVGALVAGYFLSGWSSKMGLFESSEHLEFPLPEFPFTQTDVIDEARDGLKDHLVSVGSPESLALLPLVDHLDLEVNQTTISRWLEGRNEGGDAVSIRLQGLLALSLEGETATALGFIIDAARRGDAESQLRHAAAQWRGGDPGKVDEESRRLLARAAEGGNSGAQVLLARINESAGEGEEAFRWMKRAAGLGDVSATYQLGLFFARGVGCDVSPTEAVNCFRRAAEQGDERAMYDFARCLSEGFGIEPSFHEARRWMGLASARGHGGALRWCLDREIDHTALETEGENLTPEVPQ